MPFCTPQPTWVAAEPTAEPIVVPKSPVSVPTDIPRLIVKARTACWADYITSTLFVDGKLFVRRAGQGECKSESGEYCSFCVDYEEHFGSFRRCLLSQDSHLKQVLQSAASLRKVCVDTSARRPYCVWFSVAKATQKELDTARRQLKDSSSAGLNNPVSFMNVPENATQEYKDAWFRSLTHQVKQALKRLAKEATHVG